MTIRNGRNLRNSKVSSYEAKVEKFYRKVKLVEERYWKKQLDTTRYLTRHEIKSLYEDAKALEKNLRPDVSSKTRAQAKRAVSKLRRIMYGIS